MGREVRRVPPGWHHPRSPDGHYIPLLDGYYRRMEQWDHEERLWEHGLYVLGAGDAPKRRTPDMTGIYSEFAGERPERSDYMPDWPADERTHWQMYETTSEGTPISPPCPTPESLARWLADNEASAFARDTATYEEWLATIQRGGAVSAMWSAATGLVSGVRALAEVEQEARP